MIRSLNVYDQEFKKDKLAFIESSQASRLANVTVKEGDILLNITGASIARCCVAPIEYLPARVNQHVSILRPISYRINSYYLCYLLTSPNHKEDLLSAGEKAGATRQALTKNQLQSYNISVPPLSEQERIVGILDEAFVGIATATANAKSNLDNACELFQSVLQFTFEHKGEDWVETTLGKLCHIKHGFAFKSKFFKGEGDHVVLTPGNFHESGGYRDRGDKTKFYVGEIPNDYILEKGDFLFAMTEQAVGLLGSSMITPESGRFLHNQRLGLIQIAEGVTWCNDLFFHQFNTVNFREAVQRTASGVKVRHTSPTKLGAVKVCFPKTFQAQQQVANYLNEISAQTRRIEFICQQKLTSLAELKQSLLQRAFSGKL